MKKFIWSFLWLLGSFAQAQTVEIISPRQAEDILKYRAPTLAVDLVGSWRKVLHGPTEKQMGQYNPNGIVEGLGKNVTVFHFGTTDLSEWLPKEISQVYFVDPKVLITPELNARHRQYTEIIQAPSIVYVNKAAVKQIGNGVQFEFKTTYRFRTKLSFYSSSCYFNCGITFSFPNSSENDETFYIDTKYQCALQFGNKNRLICEQEASIYGYLLENDLQSLFPKLIAFERVQ